MSLAIDIDLLVVLLLLEVRFIAVDVLWRDTVGKVLIARLSLGIAVSLRQAIETPAQ